MLGRIKKLIKKFIELFCSLFSGGLIGPGEPNRALFVTTPVLLLVLL